MVLAIALPAELLKTAIKSTQKRRGQCGWMQDEVIGQGILFGKLNKRQIVLANIIIVNKAVLGNDANAQALADGGIKIVRIAYGIGYLAEAAVLANKG